jgi:hypothetical protein
VQKALPYIKTFKVHHPKDHDNECSSKMSIHLEAQKKHYPKNDATMDVKYVPHDVLGDESIPSRCPPLTNLKKLIC